MCDTNGSGKVSKKELSEFMAMWSDKDDREVMMLMAMVDEDADGHINYEEFCKILTLS